MKRVLAGPCGAPWLCTWAVATLNLGPLVSRDGGARQPGHTAALLSGTVWLAIAEIFGWQIPVVSIPPRADAGSVPCPGAASRAGRRSACPCCAAAAARLRLLAFWR